MELTGLDEKLLYLKENYDRMIILVKELEYQYKGKDYDFRGVLREYVLIILYNFVAIKKSFNKEKAMESKPDLHPCLEQFWKPFVDIDRDLRTLRNKRLAHAGDSSHHGMTFSEFLVNSKLPGSFGDLLFLMLCACRYAEYMLANFKPELDAAIKREGSNPDSEMQHKLSFKGARAKSTDIEVAVVKCLRDNGLAIK